MDLFLKKIFFHLHLIIEIAEKNQQWRMQKVNCKVEERERERRRKKKRKER